MIFKKQIARIDNGKIVLHTILSLNSRHKRVSKIKEEIAYEQKTSRSIFSGGNNVQQKQRLRGGARIWNQRFVAFIVGELLYRKFGGKPNSGMIIILTCTVFATMILSVVGTYFVAAAHYANEAGVSAVEYFKWCMEDPEIKRSFVVDLVLTVFFTILGCAYEIYVLYKRIKRQENI